MWCSSNFITQDSIRFHLFQRILTGASTKWYVDELHASHSTFTTLAKSFLSYLQLPFCYDTNTKLLTTFCQTSTTRLSDHVKKWCIRRNTCKALEFEDRVYMDWFLRSNLAPIGKYFASHFP